MLNFIKKYFGGLSLDDKTSKDFIPKKTEQDRIKEINKDYEYYKEKYKDKYRLVYDEADNKYFVEIFNIGIGDWFKTYVSLELSECSNELKAKEIFIGFCREKLRLENCRKILV